MAVKCPKCRTDNTETAHFCSNCATPLEPAEGARVAHTMTLEPPREELTMGSVFAGRYQIIEELGRGGMGRVYRALDQKINEEVALKLIKPEIASEERTLERFANELKVARKIGHKNVGRMFHLSEDRGTHYFTMEYVPGEDLKRMIRMSKQLSIATAVGIARQVAEGLAEAHRLGIVHRDLKPGNIMIDRDGVARIMDFGIARLLGAKGVTGAGVAVGTPDYMSPEQVEGKEVDGRSDVYSLGIILYEMVTGRVPFEAETALAVGYKHKHEEPTSPKALNPQVPDDLSALILQCLEKKPEKRWPTADDLRAGLEKIEGALPTTTAAAPAPASKRTSLTSREITITFTAKKLIIPGLALTAVVAAVILALLFLPHRAPPQKAGPAHRQITYTGTASSPAISPDGKFLAYADSASGNEQVVMVRDMVGEQTIEVGRGRNCGGLRWSPDGSELLYYGQRADGTWVTSIVPRLGGRIRQLEEVYGAAWSPDGSRLVHWSDEKKLLFFTDKTTGESKSISLGPSFPPYVEDVDWSPSGRFILLLMYDDNDNYSLRTVTADGSRQNIVFEDPKFYCTSPRWSPRGDAVYYLRDRSETTDIMKVAVSPETGKPSKPPVPIIEGHQVGYYFTLTSDGKRLCYARDIWSSNLWLATCEGSGREAKVALKQLTTGTMMTMAPVFSPDGTLIAYGRGKSGMDIFVMPADGRPPQQLTFMNAWSNGPAWSPDGREIAFTSTGGQGDGTSRIWKISAGGGTPQPIAKADGIWPTWAPGRRILFQAYSKSSLMALDPEKGEVATLWKTESEWQMLFPTWSPDGTRIAVRFKKGPETGIGTWILSADGSKERMIRKGLAIPMAWSADGKRLYASETVPAGMNILAISPEDGQGDVLFTIPLNAETGRVLLRPHTVDGRRVVFEGRRTQSDVWVVENFDPEIK